MPIPFFSQNQDPRLMAAFAALASIIVLTKSQKLLMYVFETFMMHHLGNVTQSLVESKGEHIIEHDIPDQSVFNKNCYAYLVNLQAQLPEEVAALLPSELKKMLLRHCQPDGYHDKIAYGNLYKVFFESLEDEILTLYDKYPTDSIKQFINSLFDNHNQSINRTFDLIESSLLSVSTIQDLRSHVAQRIKQDDQQAINAHYPSYKRTLLSRGINISVSTLKEQYTTNIPSKRDYSHHSHLPFNEFRFGTQAQRVNNEARVNPFFLAWCAIKKPAKQATISHVYFNNLARDRDTLEGRKEMASTHALHDIEKKYPHIAVITLPADKGLFHKSVIHTENNYDTQETLDKFIRIAREEATDKEIHDFHISDDVRRLLYCDKDAEKEVLLQLLEKSLDALGLKNKPLLTSKERHALYFHFIKYELTDYIILTLNPQSINFACKDAIDRAGVSSLYFNLIKSIELNQPMTYTEFQMGLHAPSALVKGRAMNHHFEMIHNVLSQYLKANPMVVDNECPWLSTWCETFNYDHLLQEEKSISLTT